MQIWKKFHLIRHIYGPYNLTFLNAQGPISQLIHISPCQTNGMVDYHPRTTHKICHT
jgi:hypothetical protein